MALGNTLDIESPYNIVPSHSIAVEFTNSRMMPTDTKQPTRLMDNN
jgi:hypothetical protein